MRDYSKFFTPRNIADIMVDKLDIQMGDFILEPSAGVGNIVKAVYDRGQKLYGPFQEPDFHNIIHPIDICAIEIESYYTSLYEVANCVFIQDFLTFKHYIRFDKIIANPPFGNGVDLLAHLFKMFSLLKSGGKLISIIPEDFNLGDFNKGLRFMTIEEEPLENWATNKDGSVTRLKLIEVIKR